MISPCLLFWNMASMDRSLGSATCVSMSNYQFGYVSSSNCVLVRRWNCLFRNVDSQFRHSPSWASMWRWIRRNSATIPNTFLLAKRPVILCLNLRKKVSWFVQYFRCCDNVLQLSGKGSMLALLKLWNGVQASHRTMNICKCEENLLVLWFVDIF